MTKNQTTNTWREKKVEYFGTYTYIIIDYMLSTAETKNITTKILIIWYIKR